MIDVTYGQRSFRFLLLVLPLSSRRVMNLSPSCRQLSNWALVPSSSRRQRGLPDPGGEKGKRS